MAATNRPRLVPGSNNVTGAEGSQKQMPEKPQREPALADWEYVGNIGELLGLAATGRGPDAAASEPGVGTGR